MNLKYVDFHIKAEHWKLYWLISSKLDFIIEKILLQCIILFDGKLEYENFLDLSYLCYQPSECLRFLNKRFISYSFGLYSILGNFRRLGFPGFHSFILRIIITKKHKIK